MNDDIIQFDYLPEEKIVKINLPEEVLKSIDTIIITKHFKDEITISRKENINNETLRKDVINHNMAGISGMMNLNLF